MSDEEKERIGITVSKENLEWLDENYNNRSGYIDDLLTQARMNGGDIDSILRKQEKRKLQREMQNHRSQLELLEQQLEDLEEADSMEQHEYDRSLEDLLDTLRKGGKVWPSHNLVQEVSRQHSVEPGRVIDDLRERAGDDITEDQFEQP